jgi:RluA family pseudouridine synthase
MAKPQQIELGDGTIIPILYEDRSVLAIDKPAGWLLAPKAWDRTGRNLQLALESSLREGAFWARSRQLKFLRHVHRLDADTSGLLLLAKSAGALKALSELFESRRVEKVYLAVVRGVPKASVWSCNLALAPHPLTTGLMQVDQRRGKPAETQFRVLATRHDTALVAARPMTGRTHQIRVHLAVAGHPALNDRLYGPEPEIFNLPGSALALRAVKLAYPDPFQKKLIRLEAPWDDFVRKHGFAPAHVSLDRDWPDTTQSRLPNR